LLQSLAVPFNHALGGIHLFCKLWIAFVLLLEFCPSKDAAIII
jgi:hypothetical protein